MTDAGALATMVWGLPLRTDTIESGERHEDTQVTTVATTDDSVCAADDNGRSVLGRVNCIISAFDDDNVVLSLNELTQRTELPKSTVHRIVEQLRHVGWLEREVSGYRVGIKLFEVGGLAARRNQLCESAFSHLHALSTDTELAVQLAILEGTDVLYLERIPMGDFHLPTRDGGRIPAYCTALGKAMLAFDDEATEQALATPLRRRTSRTLTTPAGLHADLERIRDLGLAFDEQEAFDGLACVAAPIRNAGRAIGAVSVTGPVHRIDLLATAPLLRQAARCIWDDRFQVRRRPRY